MFAARTDWPAKPNRWSELAVTARARGGLIDLTVSNPTTSGLDYERERILAALANPAALAYDPQPRGLALARAAVADYYAARGVAIGPDQLLLTASTSEGYALLFRLLCNPGQGVMTPSPSYPLIELLAAVSDVDVSSYSNFYDHGWHLDAAGLERALQPGTRALLLVHPNNPTGQYCRPEEWERLQDLAVRHDLALIVDEVFFDYPGEAAAVSLDYPRARALTFVLNGLSKLAGLPQMKLGWMAVCGPPALRQAALDRLEILNDTFLSAAAPIQHAAPELMRTGAGLQARLRARIDGNLGELDQQCAGGVVERLGPQAGWSVVVRLPATRSDEEWAEWLMERAGVLVHPGHFYSLPQEAHVVLSLLPEPDGFASGVKRLLEAAKAGAGCKL